MKHFTEPDTRLLVEKRLAEEQRVKDLANQNKEYTTTIGGDPTGVVRTISWTMSIPLSCEIPTPRLEVKHYAPGMHSAGLGVILGE